MTSSLLVSHLRCTCSIQGNDTMWIQFGDAAGLLSLERDAGGVHASVALGVESCSILFFVLGLLILAGGPCCI